MLSPSRIVTILGVESEELVDLVRTRDLARSGEARRIRVEAGLSLAEVAAVVGCAPNTVWRWERGERMPRGDLAARYGQLLKDLAGQAA